MNPKVDSLPPARNTSELQELPPLDCRGKPLPPWWEEPCDGCYAPTCSLGAPRSRVVDLVVRRSR